MEDYLFTGDDQNRFLGHRLARYGFILFTRAAPTGRVLTLALPPQSLEQDEEAAITITPTQGGKFIENKGNIFKDINISGTTGFLPAANFKGAPGVQLPSSPTFSGQDSALARVSGYSKFHELRSLIREYWSIHRSGSQEERVACRLVWFNQKDGEAWVVEPLSFRMSRSKNNRMLYDYSIRLRTIERGVEPPPPADRSALVPSLVLVKQTFSNVQAEMDRGIAILRDGLTAFNQVRFIRTQILAIINTATTLSASVRNLAAGVAEVIDVPRVLVQGASTAVVNVFDDIDSASDVLLKAAVFDPIGALILLKQQFDFIAAKPELFRKKWEARWAQATERFNRTYGIGGDANESLDAATTRNGLEVTNTPPATTSIYQLAKNLTGDPTRAYDIILLNGLLWPYISATASDRLPGTVAPGDPILVPVAFSRSSVNNNVVFSPPATELSYRDEVSAVGSLTLTKLAADQWRPNAWKGYSVSIVSGTGAGQRRLIVGNTETTLLLGVAWDVLPDATSVFLISFPAYTAPRSKGLSQLFGVDLQVKRTSTGRWDLVVNRRGDLALVRNEDNLQQALTWKFAVERGDLVAHPWFGYYPVQGTAATEEQALLARYYAEQTLRSDSRIEDVQSIRTIVTKDVAELEARLVVKGSQTATFTSPLI